MRNLVDRFDSISIRSYYNNSYPVYDPLRFIEAGARSAVSVVRGLDGSANCDLQTTKQSAFALSCSSVQWMPDTSVNRVAQHHVSSLPHEVVRMLSCSPATRGRPRKRPGTDGWRRGLPHLQTRPQ